MSKLMTYETVLRALGVVLIAAGILKGHQLLTEPVGGVGIWSYRPLLILQVEAELALGVWLLSPVFRRLAWVTALMCFAVFSCVTCHKVLTGTASCGCFGKISVDPRITLLLIDLPAMGALLILRPANSFASVRRCTVGLIRLFRLLRGILLRREHPLNGGRRHCRFTVVLKKLRGALSEKGVLITALTLVAIVAATTPVLALAEPPKVTRAYEVLEPETWVGSTLPILGHIDIAAHLASGNWLIVLHHIDCDDCRAVIPGYQQMARDSRDTESKLNIALIEVPPYQSHQEQPKAAWLTGKLDQSKRWFVVTPAALALANGQVIAAYGNKVPDLPTVVVNLMETHRTSGRSQTRSAGVQD